jgi:manganese/iron transport system permease protein
MTPHEHVHDPLWAEFGETIVFLLPSLLTAAAVGVAGAVVGVFVLLRRQALVALALPNVVAVGAAIGLSAGIATLPPAIAAVVAALVLLALAQRQGLQHISIPALFVGALCLSFLLIANSGEHLATLEHLFVGMDVAVTQRMAWASVPILLMVSVLCAVLWRRWLLIAQIPTAAQLARLDPVKWDAFFLILLAVVVVAGTNALGIVMVTAMLFLPPAAALPWAPRIPAALIGSVGLSLVCLIVGLVLSIRMNWPLSHSVGGVGFVVVVLSHLARRLR